VLANDNDDDIPAQTLTAELVEPYGEGELILNADGSFTYTPPTELPEGGQTVFTYEVSDGQDGTDQATITFAIRLENAAPTDISLDPLSVAENEPYEGTLATVDTDLPNDAHVYALVAGIGDTDNGAFTIDGDQLVANEPFNYEVKASYNVRIRSTDLFGAWYEKRFVISVQDANDAPVAEDDEFAIKQGEEVDITLKATDEDEDGLTFAIFDEPEHGEVVVNTVGTTINTASGILRVIEPQVTYIPDEGWAGVDSFTFKAIDDKGALSNLATITITVNDAPVAVDDEYETDEDASLTVEAEEGVLANDSDVYPEEPLTAILVSDVTHGELNLAEEGSFVYIPEANFFGEDSFTYKASDGELESEPATVTITIAAVNDAPVAEDIEAETAEDEAVEITLVASDVEDDELTAEIVVEPLHGEVTLEGFTATYTPDPDYNGMDSFTYKVNDGELYSEPATVTITVAAVNDAPVAADIEAETDEDTAVEITLVASDVDSDELTAEIVDPPLHGEVTLEGFTATYTPDLDYNGIDSFTYKASDGELESEPATVTIAVLPVNDGPQAVDDEYETLMGVPLEVSAPGVMENDIDPDEGDVWTVELVSDVSHGTLVFKSDGSFTYEPDAGFYGVDTFTYLLISVPGVNSEYSDTATVTITVRPAVRIFLPIILK
jgi:VCBS repeat-containing protein